jgi:hypothetical protein
MYLEYYAPQFPMQQGASAGPYPRMLFYPGMGFYRPNQSFYRGITPGTSRLLGQTLDPTAINLTDPGTLLMIAGAGFMVWYLLKGVRRTKRAIRGYRRRRSRRSRSFEPNLPFGGLAHR